MDRDIVTVVDAGDGSGILRVTTREASEYWPRGVIIEQDSDLLEIVLLPGESETRRFIRALQRKNKVFRGHPVPETTRIGRESSGTHLIVYVDHDPSSIFVQQEGDVLVLDSPAQVPELIDAIRAHAKTLGWGNV